MSDIRAALERLVSAYDNNEGLPIAEWIAAARDALAAEPVVDAVAIPCNADVAAADHPDGPWRPIPAPQSGWPRRTDEPAVQSREPASVAPDARPLGPDAQAIVKAFDDRYELLGPLETDWQEQCLAAALRAVADQACPSDAMEPRNYLPLAIENDRIRREILAIAAELEGRP